MGDGIIGSIAFGFLVMGGAAIVTPIRVTEQFGIPVLTAAGRNEVRAVYGGFGLAMAGLLATVLVLPDLRAGVTLTIGVALGGMAGGRLLSALMDRTIGRFPLFYLGLESLAAASLLYLA